MDAEARPAGPGLPLSFDLSAYAAAFQEECEEHLRRLDRGIPGLAAPAADSAAVAALFRSAHTIKGGARMMGHAEIGELAQGVEAVLDGVRRGRIHPSSATVEGLLAGVAALREQIAALGVEDGAAPSTGALIQRLEELAGANRAADSAGEAPSAIEAVSLERSAEAPSGDDDPFADPTVIGARLRRLLAVEFDPLEAATGPTTAAPLPTDAAVTALDSPLELPVFEPLPGVVSKAAGAAGSPSGVPAAPEAGPGDDSVRVSRDRLNQIASLAGELLVSQRDVHECVDQARDMWGLVQAYDRATASGETEAAAGAWAALRATIARWQRAAIRADERAADLAQALHQELGQLRP
jgi:chemotaxis protein histidine kinase CheA